METMEEFFKLIRPDFLILVPVLYLVGIGLKKSKVKDKWIPALLGIGGVVLSFIGCVATGGLGNIAQCVFTAVTQGILSAGTGVYLNQIIKQFKKEN